MDKTHQHHNKKKYVLMDQDGSPEDVISMLLILLMKDVELLGVVVTPGDCFIREGMELTLKVLEITKRNIEVNQSSIVAPFIEFPVQYKIGTIKANNFPIMINQKFNTGLVSKESTVQFMARKIRECKHKVTLSITGPLTNVAKLFEADPSIKDRIEEIVIMGGAIDVVGNVFTNSTTALPAEWNIYWDANSAKAVFSSGVRILLCTLDGTNHVPLTYKMLKKMARVKNYNLMNLASNFYSLYELNDYDYADVFYFWDTVSVSHLAVPGLSELEHVEIDVITEGHDIGRTIRKPGSGIWVYFTKKVYSEKFYDFFFNILHANGTFEQVEPEKDE